MKKVISMILMLILVTSVTACSKGGESETVKTSGKDYDPFGKYEKELLITGIMEYLPNTDERIPKEITPDNQEYIKMIKEELNINFQYKWKVPSTQYQDKFNMMLLSGDIPDIMKVYATDFYRLMKTGKLADLTDAIKYLSPEVKGYLDTDPSIMKSVSDDKGIWAIPVYTDTRKSVPVMYIRQDWLTELGLDMPTTPEELKNVAKMFVEKKGAKFGIATGKDLVGPQLTLNRYMNTMGSYPYAWIKGEDGTLVAGEVHENTKNALKYLHEFYTEGLLPKDFASQTVDTATSAVVSGEVGIIYGPWWQYEWPINSSFEKNPTADWVAAPIAMTEGFGAGMARRQIDYYYVVSKKCKNPEALIKMINIYVEADGTERTKPENGYVWNWVPTQFTDPSDINTEFESINAQLKLDPEAKDKAPEDWSAQAIKIWKALPTYLKWKSDKTANAALWNSDNSNIFGNILGRIEENGAWGTIRKTVETNRVTYNEYFGEPTQNMQNYGATLASHTEETFLKMIMGTIDIDSGWDSYVQKWYDLGGTKTTEDANTWYNEYGVK